MNNDIPRALRQGFALRITSAGFLTFWCLLAAFPIFWIAVMSFKIPVDAFSSNPLNVIFGPQTRSAGKGLSILDIVTGLAVIWVSWRIAIRYLKHLVERLSPPGLLAIGWALAAFIFAIGFIIVFFFALPALLSLLG